MLALLAKGGWDFVTKPESRKSFLREVEEAPRAFLFVVLWITFSLMFFLGLLIRPLGQTTILYDGWKVWAVGLIGSFAMMTISWFVNIDKLDKRK
jgi:hypothetical protein